MHTDGHGSERHEGNALLHAVETEAVIGAAMEVLNILGHGLLEKPYENALAVELRLLGIPFVQQPRFEVDYKGEHVGLYVPDLIVFGRIVIDLKAIDQITDHEIGRMLNYLKITGQQVGLILNFKYAKLKWKRVVL